MTQANQPIKNVAPLANVARLLTLATRLENRAYGLPGIGCFFSPAGYGKTTSGIFATNAINACHITALPVGGIRSLFGMIVAELGGRPTGGVADLFLQAVQLQQKTNRILIIDEADQLLPKGSKDPQGKVIDLLRHLHDTTEVPLILMGEELLPQKLKQWERVHGRILSWVAAEPATMEDINFLAPIYAPGIAIDSDLRAAVLHASSGSLRIISTNLANMYEFAASKGLKNLGQGEWANRAFHTGEAPIARPQLGIIAGRSRRSAA
ncbi:MAG: hypothetical protein JWS10_960 [Cypionkella sp.]|uniref:AAA family ATPase n=1 Tax=Cypionkella sp. TaxID=2811411 RepID=UPI00261EAB37|nr:ATP-binding protein [Cypionkella sp.]MDB5658345.1 hypothetical protein [Cypionkella sp.]